MHVHPLESKQACMHCSDCTVYLDASGTVWLRKYDDELVHCRYYVENSIKIIDIACCTSYMFALDDAYNLYLHKFDAFHSPSLFLEGSSEQRSIQCGADHSYMRVHLEDSRHDLHFLWGANDRNQCLTFDGRTRVSEPHCINDTIWARTGGLFVESVSLGAGCTTIFVAV